MRIYLIDFENVHYEGLSGILELDKEDKVYIFYSDNGKRLTFDLHVQIINSPAQFFYNKAVVGGKNALDHQLSSYLGYLISHEKAQEFYVVSKDQGYRHLISFWEDTEPDIKISLIDSIKMTDDVVKDVPAAEIEAEKPVKTTRKRGRRTKAKIAAKPAAANAEEAVAVDDTTKEAAVETKEDAPAAKAAENACKKRELPHIIEFVLPPEVSNTGKNATGKPGKAAIEPAAAETPAVSAEKAVTVLPIVEIVTPSRDGSGNEKPVVSEAKNDRPLREKKTAAKRPGRNNRQQKPAAEKALPVQDTPVKTTAAAADVIRLLPDAEGKDWLADVVEYINSAGGKTDLYNKIRRRLGQDKGRTVYNELKKLI